MVARTVFQIHKANGMENFSVGQVLDVASGMSARMTTSIQINTGQFADAMFRTDAGVADPAVPGDDVYIHMTWDGFNTGTAAAVMGEVRDNSNQPYVSIRKTAVTGELGLYFNSTTGASPTWNLGGVLQTNHSGGYSQPVAMDVRVVLGTSGNSWLHTAEFFFANARVSSFTFTNANFQSISRWSPTGFQNISARWGELWGTIGIPTPGSLGFEMRHTDMTGATNTTASGTYTDINEAVVNDTTNVVSNAAGQIFLANITDVTFPTGMLCYGVNGIIRWKHDGTAPTQLKVRLNVSSADADYATQAGSTGYVETFQRWSLNPTTGLRFTNSEINAMKAGFFTVA